MESISQLAHLALQLVQFILHFDVHLEHITQAYGAWTYGILWAIVFCETGLVVTPILPGDSLLFAVGAFAARGSLSLGVAFLVLSLAAVLGDAANYSIGYFAGPASISGNGKWIKREYVERTRTFFEKYGGKTILMARFIPIVRTFAPFMAGVGKMSYSRFAVYNIAGGVLWISICLLAGFFFGNLPIVKKNFSLVVLGIVAVSLMPAFFEWLRTRKASRIPSGLSV